MNFKVTIHLYDLSQGLARTMSPQFLGKQIDGIWHTGIVVYGKEYYFGGGICCDPPGQTPYGSPIKKIDVGETEIPQEVFMDFLKDVNHKFTINTYDLFENNCNNFTDACCEFLIGQGIPDYITGLPKEVLATPFGMMIKPLVDNFTKALNQNSHPLPQMFEGENNASSMNLERNVTAQTVDTINHTHANAVEEVTSIERFFGIIDEFPGVIVDFFSFTCPPCMRIKPFFEKLAQDYKTKNPKLKFISINTQATREVASEFSITAIPTFIGFYNGDQIERFSGADPTKIQKLIATLEGKINGTEQKQEPIKQEAPIIQKPPTTTTTNPVPSQTITPPSTQTNTVPSSPFKLFNTTKKDLYKFEGDNYALPIGSIKGTLEKYPSLNSSESKAIFVAFAQNAQVNAKSFPDEEKARLVDWILECLSFIDIGDKSMGFVDLLKMLCLESAYAGAVAKNEKGLEKFVKYFDQPEKNLKEIQKGLKMMLLRLITNVTAHEGTKTYFEANISSFVKVMTSVGRIFKDEKPSIHPIVMSLWNLTQNLHGTKEYSEVQDIITGFSIETFNGSNDNDVMLYCGLILAWVSHNNKSVRSVVNEKLDKAKLDKLKTNSTANVANGSKDLAYILEGGKF